MERLIYQKFLEWKSSPDRKPLLIKGARQVGKTYACFDFGKKNYDNVVYFHFEGEKGRLHTIFASDLNPLRIIEELRHYSGQPILENKTLLIFDEIQASEKALTSLKFFSEEAPNYHIMAAGSLLGTAINRGNFSFPVGKVDIVTMYPLNFEEFLMATNNQMYISMIKKCFKDSLPLEKLYHDELNILYRKYLVVGGYPASILGYLKNNEYDIVRSVQANITESYLADMAKYASRTETIRSIALFDSLPAQLAKENSKFQYSLIKSGARAKSYEESLHWLKTANVVIENIKITAATLPLNIHRQIDAFKIYMSDVGLLCFKSGIMPHDILLDGPISSNMRGLLAENYVAQTLQFNDLDLNYWESSGSAEVDFVIRLDDSPIPIEVKSADNVRSKSLNIFIKKYSPKYSIRLSTKNFGFENNIKSVPLYATFCIGSKF